MVKTSTSYLKQRYNKWSVVVEIPKALREGFGRPRFAYSLGTDSLSEANQLKHVYVGDFKKAIQLAKDGRWEEAHRVIYKRLGGGDDNDPIRLRDILKSLPYGDGPDSPETIARDGVEIYISNKAEKIEEKFGQDQAKQFYGIATGKMTPITEYLDAWLLEKSITEKTKNDYRSIIQAFADRHASIEEIKRKQAGQYVTKLRVNDGLGIKRVRVILGTLGGYWDWLADKEHIDPDQKNPWEGHKLPNHTPERRKHFEDTDFLRIFKAVREKGSQQALDICRIGLFTGMRIEEICQLKTENTYEDYLEIVDAKTEAGIRVIPIHPELKPFIERMKKESKDGYIISGVRTKNKNKIRSAQLDKDINGIIHALGYTSRVQKFHSFRASLSRKFKAAGVDEATAADTMGHKINTMTYGLYAGIIDLEPMKEAMSKIKFSAELMQVFKEV